MEAGETLFDIRDADAMDLLLTEEPMAIWELIRRRGKALSAAEIAKVTGVDLMRVHAHLDRLEHHGLVHARRASAARRMATYRHTCNRIGIGMRSNSPEDDALWDGYSKRVDEVAQRLARNQLPLGDSSELGRMRCFYVMPIRLTHHERTELRHRLDELTAFLRMLQERHSGEETEQGDGDFHCNFRFEMQLQPLAHPVLPQPVIWLRVKDREPLLGLERVDPMTNLSVRERQVAQAIVRGRSRTETAAELDLKPGTVATLTKRIYRKLGVNNRIELVRIFANSTDGGTSAVA